MTEQTMRWTTDDVEAAEHVLALASDVEPVGVVALTDEEIVILDGVQHDQLAPMPWLDEQTQAGADRSLLGRVALRSLLARGFVTPTGDEADGTIGIDAGPEITGTLVLRRTAQALLTVERTTSAGTDWVVCYAHEHDGDRVLEEAITPSGHHGFTVYPRERLGERLRPYLDPTGAAVADAPAQPVDVAALSTHPSLAEATSASVVGAYRADTGVLVNVTVYGGPAGVFVLRAGPDGADATLAAVSGVTLDRIVEDVLSGKAAA